MCNICTFKLIKEKQQITDNPCITIIKYYIGITVWKYATSQYFIFVSLYIIHYNSECIANSWNISRFLIKPSYGAFEKSHPSDVIRAPKTKNFNIVCMQNIQNILNETKN